MGDFGATSFGTSHKDGKNIKTESVLHPGRIHRWSRRNKKGDVEYWMCNHCRTIKEADKKTDGENKDKPVSACNFKVYCTTNYCIVCIVQLL